MKKMSSRDFSLCRFQGKVFEKSLDYTNSSSLIFIRRFMLSSLAEKFDDKTILLLPTDANSCIDDLDEEYGKTNYGKTKLSKNEMFWIGYIYRAICILFNLSSKKVFSLFNAREIVKYYYVYHTFDIEEAAERMMENIGYEKKDINQEAYKLMKKLMVREKLIKLLGKEVTIYIDRPIGSKHPNHQDITYKVNYGFIKEIVAADNEYQDAYLFGINEPIKKIKGRVYAVVERENDIEDKLIVVVGDKEYTNEEIKDLINFQEQHFKYKVIQ